MANIKVWDTTPEGGTRSDVIFILGHGKTLKFESFSRTTTGNILAGVSAKKIQVYAYVVCATALLTVNLRDGTTGANIGGSLVLAANAIMNESVNPPAFLFETSSDTGIDLVISGVGTASGRISYWEE